MAQYSYWLCIPKNLPIKDIKSGRGRQLQRFIYENGRVCANCDDASVAPARIRGRARFLWVGGVRNTEADGTALGAHTDGTLYSSGGACQFCSRTSGLALLRADIPEND